MDKLTPPQELSLEGNLAQNWKRWKQEFNLYMVATEYKAKSDEVKSSLLLHCIGARAREVYNNFVFEQDEELKYDKVLEKYEEYLSPQKNLTYARYKFFTYRQGELQSFDNYYTELRKLANDCELNALYDSLLKDMVVIGLHNKKMQETLLRDSTLTLDKVIQTCKNVELTHQQARMMQQSTHKEYDVDSVRRNRSQASRNNEAAAQGYDKGSDGRNSYTRTEIINQCMFCSYSHRKGSCPAYNKLCILCSKRGHFAKCCPNKKVGEVKVTESGVQNDASDESDDENYYFIGTISEDENTDEEWCIDLVTNNTIVNYKIDTGAQVNILPYSIYTQLVKRPKLHKGKVNLTAYNGTEIPVKGSCILNIDHHNSIVPVLFVVADTTSTPILGLKTSTNLNLLKRVMTVNKCKGIPSYLSEYKDCFGEIGCMLDEHHIVIDETVPAVVNPPRRIPIAIRERLKEELDRMVKLEIIAPIEEPTNWVNNLVIVEKPNGSLRVCLDPKELNKAIKRPHYSMPTTEDILAKMSHPKYFTKLDASNAYWQIRLDDDSSKLLTFNTPYGRYRFLRMAYGVHSASDVCQQRIVQMIEGIEGVCNSQDDILIWGEDIAQLESRTKQVLDSLRKNNLKLNRAKCQFNQQEITFLGHKLTSKGIYPDPKKIEAIVEMKHPENVKELQRFLGLINYLGKFIPDLTDRSKNLRKLLEKDALWQLDEVHKQEINNLKQVVTKAPILSFYDPNLATKISSDASSTGLGAVLEQKHGDIWHPVAYASRSMTKSEQNYCQLEKEVLSIVFACDKFHDYIYGTKFNVYNDHLPLKSIFNKSIVKAPPRIQRFLLRLQRYNFEMHYIKGSLLTVADTLSRATLKNDQPEIDENELNYYVHSVVRNYLVSDKRLAEIKEATKDDKILQVLHQYIHKGWPSKRKHVPASIRPYFNHRDELSTTDGIILKGNQIVIPQDLQAEIRGLLHIAHLGIVKIKERAREVVYWPGMSTQLQEVVRCCDLCQKYQNLQPKETFMPQGIPEVPWAKVGTDLFVLKSKVYLIVVDYTTNFFDISMLPNKESPTVVVHTKRIFSRYGIPKVVYSDNGPEFIAKEYAKFSKEWDFYHDTSSPKYPESNGQVERTIQTVKKTLLKAFDNQDDPYLALLALRTAPGPYKNASPATLLYNRNIRTIVPSVNTHFSKTNNKIKREFPDKKSQRNLPELAVGDNVRIHDGNTWSRKGVVIEKSKNPRSYIVLTDKGSKIRRNRRHLLHVKGENRRYSQDDDEQSIYSDLIRSNIEQEEVINELENEISQLSIIDSDEEPEPVPVRPRTTRSGRRVNLPPRYGHFDMSR